MTGTPTEVEAKLVAAAPDATRVIDALATAPAIGGLPAGPTTGEDLQDIYLDTPQRALAAWHGAMRIRVKNGQTLLTVKGPAVDRAGPAISRAELESPFTESNVHRTLAWLAETMPDRGDVPRTPRVQLAPPSIEGFDPFHDRTTRRLRRELTTPAGPVELAIDRAVYRTPRGDVTLVEIEVEAIGGTPVQGVVAGTDAVQAHCAPIAPLRRWHHSKLSVGIALERLAGDDLTEDGVLTDAGLDRVSAELT